SGGSDIISMIINKYTRIPLGTLVIIVDTCITLSTLVAFGELRLPLYSIMVIVIEGWMINWIMALDFKKKPKEVEEAAA
ncbi:MAG: YitT family protein, partial [Bacteroidales bacterium]|nr:YitT family protein [Bacteroidales bacterium]